MNLENVRFADQFPCPSSPGCGGKSDFGAQVNAAYTSCPSTGCRIQVPAGSHTVSTPISFTTLNKPVVLQCDAGTTEALTRDRGTTALYYTGTSGAAITMATGGGAGSGVQGCALFGPGVRRIKYRHRINAGKQCSQAELQRPVHLWVRSRFAISAATSTWITFITCKFSIMKRRFMRLPA